MQIVVLLTFGVALTAMAFPTLEAPRWVLFPAMAGYLAVAAVLARFNTAWCLRILRRDVGLPRRALRLHAGLMVLEESWMIGGLCGVILLGYGQWIANDLGLASIPLAAEAMAILPSFAALLLLWFLDYPFYAEVRRRLSESQQAAGRTALRTWNRGEFLDYNLRHSFLFIAAPVGLILLAKDSLALLVDFVGPDLALPTKEMILAAGTSLLAVGVFLATPLLIARVWRTRRLPPGPLRENLEAMCRTLRIRCRDILVWETGGAITNAAVLGAMGRLRYVLLTDALLEHMEADRIRPIFAHEAGHILSHHVFYSALFAIGTALTCGGLGEFLTYLSRWPDWTGQAVTLLTLAGAWAFGFGWISRRMERQSDVIGAWTESHGSQAPPSDRSVTPEGAAAFAWSLQKIAELNAIPAGQWNWRHGSIAGRIQYILWLGASGGSRRQIDRVVSRVKLGLWLLLAAGAAIAVAEALLIPGP